MVDIAHPSNVRWVTGGTAALDGPSLGGDNVKIELVAAGDHPTHRVHDEIWLRVLSDEVVDLPTVKKKLTPAQAGRLMEFKSEPCGYHTDLTDGPDDREGYAFEDWWVFPRRQTS